MKAKRSSEEIFPEPELLTIEALWQLNLVDLKIVAKELFELKSISKMTKVVLLEKCKTILIDTQNSLSTEPAATQYDQNLSVVQKFVSEDENRLKALDVSMQIRNLFGRNWFTVKDLEQQLKSVRRENETYLKTVASTSKNPIKIEQAQEELKKLNNTPIETLVELNSRIKVISLFGMVKHITDPKCKRPTKYRINQGEIDKQIRYYQLKRQEEIGKELESLSLEEVK